MKFLKFVLISVYVILIVLLLLSNCNGCQEKSVKRPDNPVVNPNQEDDDTLVVEPVDTAVIVEPLPMDSVTEDIIERADTVGESGKLKVTLMWDFPADIDLHVNTPNGEEIDYQHKSDNTGGKLDVDDTSGGAGSAENVYWDENPPRGDYEVSLVYYDIRTGGENGGQCTVFVRRDINGVQKEEVYQVDMTEKGERKFITRFTIQ